MNHSGTRDSARQAAFTPLAIVGIGSIFPQAENLLQFWRNIREGKDCITDVPPTHWDTSALYDPDPKAPDRVYSDKGGFLPHIDFEPMKYGVLPNAIEAIDTSQLLGLVAVEQALEDAGYTRERDFDRERVSVVLGVTGALELVIPLGARLGHPRWRKALRDAGVDEETAEDVIRRIADSYVQWQENSFPGLLGNVVAGRISKHFGFAGTNCVVDAACGSSLAAIHMAALELASGRADMVISGGVDTFNDVFMYSCFSKTPALSPSGHARPFDAEADGTTLGEGIGIVVLKRLADAEADGDRIYAVIRGLGSSSDGGESAIYEPDSEGQQKAIRRAYAQGGVEPREIELIEAHGTGTRVGDGIEARALRQVFGDAEQPWCAIGSIKSQIGHTKAAAGAAGLIKAALALYHKVLPPSIKVRTPRPELSGQGSPLFVNRQARPWFSSHRRHAGVSALGFGGSNYHCLLAEYESGKQGADWADELQWLVLCANSREQLRKRLQACETGGDWAALRRQAERLRAAFDAEAPFRMGWLARADEDQAALRRRLLQRLDAMGDGPGVCLEEDLAIACEHQAGKLAVLFPGQGAQYPGMLQTLALRFPAFFDALAEADACWDDSPRLSELIYPQESMDARQAAARLRATEHAQPALGAVEWAAFSLLRHFGLRVDAAAGHSYGELVALCAAGRLQPSELHRLSRLRGLSMARAGRGGMLAVLAPLEDIESLLAEHELDAVLANRNTPRQGVLSGSPEAIDRAEELLARQGVPCKRLDVSAAFHHPSLDAAVRPMREALQAMAMPESEISVYANTTARPYPEDAGQARGLLAEQLLHPVRFHEQIEAMYEDGVRTFLELGPHARLSDMVGEILGTRSHQALFLDRPGDAPASLDACARVLMQLSILGHPLRGEPWDPCVPAKPEAQLRKTLKVPLCGANHFVPPAPRPPRRPRTVERESSSFRDDIPMNRPQNPTSQISPQSPPQEKAAVGLPSEAWRALVEIQTQTARLHERFLAGQEQATQQLMAWLQNEAPPAATPPAATTPAATTPAATTPAATTPAATTPAATPLAATPLAATTPAATTPAATTPTTTPDDTSSVLFSIVAEKTGYPVEMLDANMTLDGDLGIDSIKRVEILSALQAALPDAPAIAPEDLGRLQTLGQIAEHLSAGRPVKSAEQPKAAPGAADASSVLFSIVAEKTGYPVEMLDANMTLDGDLGIDSIKRVEILSALQAALPDAPAIAPEDLGRLQTLGQIAEHLSAGRPVKSAEQPKAAPGAADASSVLFSIVAEKTGYPVEMLDANMTLDGDLGIDSIKRVEILSALQAALPDAPAIAPEDLGRLQTLGQIAEHLSTGKPVKSAEQPKAAPGAADASSVLFSIVAEKTGYPVEMLDANMTLDGDLGIDSIKRVEILSALQAALPDAPAIAPEDLGRLQTLGQIAEHLRGGASLPQESASPREPSASSDGEQPASDDEEDEPAPTLQATVRRQVLHLVPVRDYEERNRLTPVTHAVCWLCDDGSDFADALSDALSGAGYWVEPIDIANPPSAPSELHALVLLSPAQGMDDAMVWKYFQLLQRCENALRHTPQSMLLSISRLNGHFGLASGGAIGDILSAGLHGMLKTAHHEWPEVRCTAFDLPSQVQEPRALARDVVNEAMHEGGMEIACTPEGLRSLALRDEELPRVEDAWPLAAGDLVVVSGGARGVTAHVAVRLAERTRAALLLLGRTPLEEEATWLRNLSDEADIRQALLAHATESMSPRQLQQACARVLAQREIRATLSAIEGAGGKALYRSLDVLDASEVRRAIAEARAEHGPVRGLIHGAGVLADRLIGDKTHAQFQRVYGTKVLGLRALLSATAEDPLRFMVMFSSSTARFGRKGQVDYAVANEILNKEAEHQSMQRADCRVLAPNWGPWDGGMVDAALKRLFAEEGIAVIDLDAGADYLLRELRTPPGGAVETVVLGDYRAITKDAEPSPSPAKDEPEANATPAIISAEPSDSPWTLSLTLDSHPFLISHVMNHQAVLPMAMMVEWLAHAALEAHPGFCFHGLDDLRVFKAVTLGQHDLVTLEFRHREARIEGNERYVPVQMYSTDRRGEALLHAQATLVLCQRLPAGGKAEALPALEAWPHPMHEVYQDGRLFHGPDLHALVHIDGHAEHGMQVQVLTAPTPDQWIEHPPRDRWLADPLALDGAFQSMILWCFEHHGMGSLPVGCASYRQYVSSFPEDGVEVRMHIRESGAAEVSATLDFVDGESGSLLASMRDYRCVMGASLADSFRKTDLLYGKPHGG